jgi:mannose-6-phosphate isomerase-like protein (cupin superfamily)
MNRLSDAFEQLFVATVAAGGDMARTANFALSNVSWKDKPSPVNSSRHPVSDRHLATACANSGQQGSVSHTLARSLLAASDQLEWRSSSKNHDVGPDIDILSRNFAVATVIGIDGPLKSDKVSCGFSLQGRDIYYPPHAHYAEESYWVIGGDADWKVGIDPWFAVKAGDTIYHESEARHVMQTNELPMLTVWLWTSHLDSDVIIVRESDYQGLVGA